MTILIIEDEDRIAHWVKTYFEKAGFNTLVANDGLNGLHLARTKQPDLIILDIMLPSMDGRQICRTLRQESTVPIIMLTAKTAEGDRIAGLELGADDYVIKPFSPAELVARAQAVLRRVNGDVRQPQILQSGNISLNLTDHTCQVKQQPVTLSRIQFAILKTFMTNIGRTFSREQLLDAAFADDYDGFDRTVDVHIRRLRKRIEEDPANPQYIITVFGIGYKFSEQ